MPYKDIKRQRAVELVSVRKRRARIRAFIDSFRIACARCGYNKCKVALVFHHLNVDKEGNVSQAVRSCWSNERILAEISKCEVVCANCHAELHYCSHHALEV